MNHFISTCTLKAILFHSENLHFKTRNNKDIRFFLLQFLWIDSILSMISNNKFDINFNLEVVWWFPWKPQNLVFNKYYWVHGMGTWKSCIKDQPGDFFLYNYVDLHVYLYCIYKLHTFYFEHTWWRLFQKRVAYTKIDVFIVHVN